MKIVKITLDGFGLFEDSFEVELPGDVALIIGDNESGK
jgi:chromosome segregation ATPase